MVPDYQPQTTTKSTQIVSLLHRHIALPPRSKLAITGLAIEHACCVQDATFHPHINHHSLEIMQERRGSNGSASFLNRLEADMHGRKMRLQVGSLKCQVVDRLCQSIWQHADSRTLDNLLLCSLVTACR